MGRTLDRALAWNGPLLTCVALAVAVLAGLLLVQFSLLDAALLVGLGAVAVATLVEPLVGVSAAVFLGPLRAYLSAEVPQIPSQIAQFFVALAVAAWLARGLARRSFYIPARSGWRAAVTVFLPLLGFLGAALLSLWDAIDLPAYGVPELIKWVQIVLLYLLVGDCLTPGKLPWVVGALLVVGLFQAGVGIWQFGLRGEGPEHFAILNGRFYRAYGTFEQPNPYAGFLGMMLSLAVGTTLGAVSGDGRGEGREQRSAGECLRSGWLCILALLVVIIVLGAALGMSWSRGAWLGFGAAAMVMAIALPRKAWWGGLLVTVLIVGGVGLYTVGLLPAAVEARLTGFAGYVRFEDVRGVGINDANYAVLERLAHWQAALEMLRHNLWTGVGLGCYEPAYAAFALINWPIALGHAHNIYLNIAAETGLVGLVAYLVLWGVIFWQTWRASRHAGGYVRGLAIGLLGAWTHLSIHHLLDNLYVNNVHLHVGVLLGLLAFVSGRVSESANQRVSESARWYGKYL